MINSNGKTVKLTNDTLNLIEKYRSCLFHKSSDITLRKYIYDMSYDKIINSCLANFLYIQDELTENDLLIADKKQG